MNPRDHFRRMRPDWWPADQPWPPPASHGRRMRGRFFRRMGCVIGIFILFFTVFLIGILAFFANLLGILQIPGRNIGWIVPIAIVLVIFILGSLAWAGRGLRRISVPVGDLIEAAGRLAEGDYTVRLKEQGFPEVRSLERAFNDMAARLQINNEKRRNLLADVTHELRTPLAVIQGNIEGMIDGIYPADETHLKSILDETQVLSRLVEDLRTLALAESGALELRKEPTDPALLIADTVNSFRTQAETAGISFELDLMEPAPILNVDPQRLREILMNLIANALRYTPAQGKIRVYLSASASGQEKTAVIRVEDNGPGIMPEDLPHVFERFYKSSDSGGMGLGLSIARYLIEAQGGKIEAHSEYGKGTSIQIQLPVI